MRGKHTGLHSAQTARSCCLPTERRRVISRGSLRIVSRLAENTNSIFCEGHFMARGSKWMSGSANRRNYAERHNRELKILQYASYALLPARQERRLLS